MDRGYNHHSDLSKEARHSRKWPGHTTDPGPVLWGQVMISIALSAVFTLGGGGETAGGDSQGTLNTVDLAGSPNVSVFRTVLGMQLEVGRKVDTAVRKGMSSAPTGRSGTLPDWSSTMPMSGMMTPAWPGPRGS